MIGTNPKSKAKIDQPSVKANPKKRPLPAPITRRSANGGDTEKGADEVVNRILELVQDGYLHPGDRLPPERELIDIFSIGRPNLRESLRALQTLGVIEIRHGGGAFVTSLDARRLLAPLNFLLSLTPSVLDDSSEMRRIVEVAAVQMAAPRMSAGDVAEFDTMLQAHSAVQKDYVGFLILDSRFHSRIYQLSGNVVLEQIATALYNIGLDHRRELMSRPGEIAKSTRDHHAIVAALKTRDATAAVKAMETHLKHIAASSRQVLKARSARPTTKRS
ncbi:MAG: FadR/GntR family transcriptional regulator [Devosia sp.]